MHIVQNDLRYVILGRTALNVLWPSWRESFYLANSNEYHGNIMEVAENPQTLKQQLLDEFKEVFNDRDQSPVNNYEVNIRLTANATPIFRNHIVYHVV